MGILHILTQVVVGISMLCSGFVAFRAGFFAGLGTLILMIILIPVVSIFVRFWFEMIAVLFSINDNLRDLKKGFFGMECGCGEDCDCEDCVCGVEIDEEIIVEEVEIQAEKSAPKKTVAKKPVKKVTKK